MIVIRLAAEDDIPQILEIGNEAISPSWSYNMFFDEFRKGDSRFFVAVNGIGEPSPRILGFAVFRQVGDDGELLQIAVDKKARRSGVGDLLAAQVLAHAEKNRLESVFLEVRPSNTAAVGLYEKHGFKAVRVRKAYYDNPVEDALIMVLKLSGSFNSLI
jgi:ribosomal-protein-alanine N-acetyltransferase